MPENFSFRTDGGRVYEVSCERRGKLLVVRVDGHEIEVVPEFKGEYLVNLKSGGENTYAWVGQAGDVIHASIDGDDYRLRRMRGAAKSPAGSEAVPPASGLHVLASPIPGTVAQIAVKEGAEVVKGQLLAVVEAMKMEHSVAAAGGGIVKRVHVAPGDLIALGDPLVTVQYY